MCGCVCMWWVNNGNMNNTNVSTNVKIANVQNYKFVIKKKCFHSVSHECHERS